MAQYGFLFDLDPPERPQNYFDPKTSKEIEKKDEQVSNNSVPNIISEKDANFGLSNKQKKEADIKVIKSQLTSTIHVLFIFFNFVWSYF